ncbi:uncharacterized protein BYT42DRAFT_567394 [Radiomyces spectabilis]|uniref:uncharacterized protein n=1 Tax=Radiomyces spectabilis TaxID=64574 RepID=UPI00221E6CBC|nr:uncharacterized protein BYT42DRAFT_567394 [Radiomyces spectabilis]KAI8379084.1 hypothetical protein BYT42DRAFT_567394 [Radiomyces spectabilis]
MSTRVYIGRLARDARTRDLERLFKGYGDIVEVNVKSGFGFVEFRNPRDAEDAVYDFHGTEFLGERLIVELARGTRRGRDERGGRRRDDRPHYRLVVENVAPGTTWQELKDVMRKAGEVTFADILKNRPGEGVVEFSHRSDMEYALKKLDDYELNGERLRLREDKGRRSSRRSRSRSVSRSRSPRRRSSRRRSPSASVSRSRSRSPASRSRSPPRRRDRSASGSRSRSPPRRSSRRDRRDEDDTKDAEMKSPASDRERSPAAARDRSMSRSRSPTPDRNEESDNRN